MHFLLSSLRSVALGLGFVMILTLVAGTQESAAQCPMCKTSLESNRKDDQKAVGKGLNKGILYLLAMPFLVVGTVGGLYWHRQRRFEEVEERRRQILEN
jgi:hypothetical protein